MNDASSRRWTLRVNLFAASPLVRDQTRVRMLRAAGIEIGRSVDFRAHCWIYGDRLSIGDKSFVSYGCHIENREHVLIGAGVSLATQVSIITSTHEFGGEEKRAGRYAGMPVTLEDGVWVGARAVILPGVTLGRACVIGAGAVVTRDCAPGGVYVGTPARLHRMLEPAGTDSQAAG